MDIRTRAIPDWLVVLVALTSVLPPGTPNFLGVLAGLPLLLAGITIGGIGGGDVKLIGGMRPDTWSEPSAYGTVPCIVSAGAVACGREHGQKKNRKKQKEEKEQAYPLVPFLFAGMLIGIWIGG